MPARQREPATTLDVLDQFLVELWSDWHEARFEELTLRFKIQLRETGELIDAPQRSWAGEMANEWLKHNGSVFLPDGGVKKVPNGPHFDGLPDHVNFEDVPSGQ